MGRGSWRIGLVPVLLAGSVLAGCSPGEEDTGPQTREVFQARQALEARQAQFLSAMADRDAEAVAGHFAPDAVVHVAGMPPLQGREGIGRFYGNVFDFLEASNVVPAALHLSHAGDMAWGHGETRNEFRGPEGPVSYGGKYLMVWRKVDGNWLIAAYGISSDQEQGGR
jgi:uncharacterized protein (TIGR02246 family)